MATDVYTAMERTPPTPADYLKGCLEGTRKDINECLGEIERHQRSLTRLDALRIELCERVIQLELAIDILEGSKNENKK